MSHNSDEHTLPLPGEVRPDVSGPEVVPSWEEREKGIRAELRAWRDKGLGLAAEQNGQQALPFRLTGSQAKTAFALRQNVEKLIAGNAGRILREWRDKDGGRSFKHYVAETPENLNCTGFLTLTVGEYQCQEHGKQTPERSTDSRKIECPLCGSKMEFCQVWDAAEASRRINNLNRRLLGALFERSIVVTERHKNGAVHFHIVGVLAGRPDIRTGFDHAAVAAGDYGSASAKLRGLWAMLRETLPKYGFGRAELTPIRTTGEAIACYVSKYIEKNICNRTADDKRKKLVRYLGWSKEQLKPNDFSWGTKRACAWRCKAREIVGLVGLSDRDEVAEVFGPRWAFTITKLIQTVDDRPLNFIQWASYECRERVRCELARENKRYLAAKDAQRIRFGDLGKEHPEKFGAHCVYTAPALPDFLRTFDPEAPVQKYVPKNREWRAQRVYRERAEHERANPALLN